MLNMDFEQFTYAYWKILEPFLELEDQFLRLVQFVNQVGEKVSKFKNQLEELKTQTSVKQHQQEFQCEVYSKTKTQTESNCFNETESLCNGPLENQLNRKFQWSEDRKDLAVDLRKSVCKLLWVPYGKIGDCDRVPDNLKDIYRMDWETPSMNVEQVIQTQVKYLTKIRPERYNELKCDIAEILQRRGHLKLGVRLKKEHVRKYLEAQGYNRKHPWSWKQGGQSSVGLIEVWREYGEPLPDQKGGKTQIWEPLERTQLPSNDPKECLWNKLREQRS